MLLRRDSTDDQNEHIDMTPMVDVVFQLMTFMLFSMQMSSTAKVDVPPARHGVGVEETAATFLTLAKPAVSGGESTLVIGYGDGPTATLDQAREAVIAGLKAGRKKVVLQADGDVAEGEVLRVASAISKVEGVTVHVGVQDLKGTP